MKGFIDTETGGFSIDKNGVCEIAIIAVNDNHEVVDTFCRLIKPYTRSSETDELVSYKDDAMAVNGLSVEKLIAEGTEVLEVITALHDFIVKHNIHTIVEHCLNAFDTKRIEYLLNRFLESSIAHMRIVNTIDLAKGKYDLPSYSLPVLCEHFGIEIPKRIQLKAMHWLRLSCIKN